MLVQYLVLWNYLYPHLTVGPIENATIETHDIRSICYIGVLFALKAATKSWIQHQAALSLHIYINKVAVCLFVCVFVCLQHFPMQMLIFTYVSMTLMLVQFFNTRLKQQKQ